MTAAMSDVVQIPRPVTVTPTTGVNVGVPVLQSHIDRGANEDAPGGYVPV